MKRCLWAEPTLKINGKYEPAPCKIMVLMELGFQFFCNGWKPACLGQHPEVIDIRDLPLPNLFPGNGDPKNP
jgi:hypothetical protein